MPFGLPFGKKRAVTEEPGMGRPAGSKLRVNAPARTGLLLSTLLALGAFLLTLGAYAALQNKTNKLSLTGPQQTQYINQFQSGNQIPYPSRSHDQWAFPWYIFIFEVLLSLVLLFLICAARPLLRFKHVAMAFLVYLFVLTTLQIDSLLYLHRNSAIYNILGRGRIKTALIGTIIGAVANGLQILFLGLLKEKYKGGALDHHHGHNNDAGFGGGKRVAAEPMAGTGAGLNNQPYGGSGADQNVNVHNTGTFPHGQHPAGENILPGQGHGRTGPGMV